MSAQWKEFMQEVRSDAQAAFDIVVQKNGDRDACGFAGVTIRPARGEFVKFCKQNKIGRSGDYGGWYVPVSEFVDTHRAQGLTAREAAAKVFVQHLAEYGIRASVSSRMD